MAKKEGKKEVVTVAQTTKQTVIGGLLAKIFQPSTIAGVLTIGSVLATGGMASWLNPSTLPTLLAGLGLIATEDRSLIDTTPQSN